MDTPDNELDVIEDFGVAEDPKEKRRRRAFLFILLAIFLVALSVALLFILGVFGSSDTAVRQPPAPPPAPPGPTTPAPGKTDVGITLEPKQGTVRIAAKNVTFTPQMSAPGDKASAELEVSNTGDTPFYLTVSALLLDRGADFAPYVDASLALAPSCSTATGKDLYAGPANHLRATLASPLAPGGTTKLCMRASVRFDIPQEYEEKTGQIGLSFTAAAQPPAHGAVNANENVARETS